MAYGVAAVLLLGSQSAPAVTLLINGTTPSTRWQGLVDRARVPSADGVVSLYLETGLGPNSCRLIDHPGVGGCYDHRDPTNRRIHVDVDVFDEGHSAAVGDVLPQVMHELGHHFDDVAMTPGARARFARIWRRPNLGWWDPLPPRPGDGRPSFGDDGTQGISSSAGEWFADAYSLCALNDTSDASAWGTDAVWDFQNLPKPPQSGPHSEAGAIRARRQLRATCQLIRNVAAQG